VESRCAGGDAGGRPVPLFRRRGLLVLHRSGPNTKDGEAIFGTLPGAGLSPVLSPADGQGRLVRGEDEDGEFAFTGSMISATWEFPKERRDAVLASFRGSSA